MPIRSTQTPTTYRDAVTILPAAAMRQLQTFGLGVSSAPLMQCRRLDHVAFPQNKLITASATGIFPAARTCEFSTRSLDNRAQKQPFENSLPFSCSA